MKKNLNNEKYERKTQNNLIFNLICYNRVWPTLLNSI